MLKDKEGRLMNVDARRVCAHALVGAMLILSTIPVSAGGTWPGVQFTEVRAYAWPGNLETTQVILPAMQLKPGVINEDGALLTPDQVKRLLAAVNGKHRAYDQASCFIPHNAFVFYDASKKPVAYLEICFACMGTHAEPKTPKRSTDLIALAKIFDELKLPLGAYPNLEAFKNNVRDWK